ncbi:MULTISPECIES: TVP38/TMEM64 family protein [unclassified Aeribacillus]|uniref:TVP38/TMEM64 family protein n=1 Tax=unclassified Aeribacillus TaxID=2640495 RepID=UPI0030F57C90
MDVIAFFDSITLEDVERFFKEYRALGPLPGILLPMLEAFFPFLPLILFVIANANSFGLWFGFLYSWIGSSAGALLVFFLVRKFGRKRFLNFLSRHEKVRRMMNWVERHGFAPLFLMLCFPFTPSALVNVVAGLSKINVWQFALAVLSGKLVMIFMLSLSGYDLRELIEEPARLIIVFVVMALMWFIGKRIEQRLNVSLIKRKDKK